MQDVFPPLPQSDAAQPIHYQPEIWRVKKDTIYAAIPALEAAIEYTRELLTDHDSRLGRTTLKNRMYAERMQADIMKMEFALKELRAEPVSRVSESTADA